MMNLSKRRENLHEILCEILGSRYCYFSPPTGLKMKYPCIRYEYSNGDANYANNKIYMFHTKYTLTVIDYDPDSFIPEKLLEELAYVRLTRPPYVTDGLNHWVFDLYY